jgi:hypothetical protein
VWDHQGSGFDPAAVEILDAQGNPVRVLEAVDNATAEGPSRSAVVVHLPPGQYRIRVRGENNTTGPYRLDVRLPGALRGERIVHNRNLQLAEAAMLQREFGFSHVAQELFGQRLGIDLSVDQFRFEFDANLNGTMDARDIDGVIRNNASGAPVASVATLTRLGNGHGNVGNGEAESPAVFTLSVVSFSVFQNPALATDVDASGAVTPLDALLVINKLNADGAASVDAVIAEGESSPEISPPFYDVSGDYQITPLDVLLVVNDLNAGGAGAAAAGGEGEAVAWAGVARGTPAVAAASWPPDHDITGLSGAGLASFNVGSLTASSRIRENSAAVVVGRVALPTPADAHEFGDAWSPASAGGTGGTDLRLPEFPADLLDLDPELLDLLAEDVSGVWN